MKYRIARAKPSDDFLPFPRRYRYASARRLRHVPPPKDAPIDLSRLFEISSLPALPPPKKQKKRRLSALLRALSDFWRRRAEKRAAGPKKGAILAGALCASCFVLLLSASVVLLCLAAPYGGRYVTVTLPSFVGLDLEELDDTPSFSYFSYTVTYEYHPDVPSGHIISQSPPAGVTRRLYEQGGVCAVSLTVSRPRQGYFLPALAGLSCRDAILELRNHGVPYRIEEQYSDRAALGTVLSTEPAVGTALSAETPVTLTVSRGPQVLYVSVPTLVGLSEPDAVARLRSAGLVAGLITYAPSDEAAGTVLSQSQPATAHLPQGSAVDLRVSAGRVHEGRLVPSLYGMTRAEAEATLRRYGLVLGQVSGEGGTVVSQSPAPGQLITSAVVSVDLHLGA